MTTTKYKVTAHAVDRYVERVRPTLTKKQARKEIEGFLAAGIMVQAEWPPWVAEMDTYPDHWLMLGDDVAFSVLGVHLTTCMVKGTIPAATRAARNHARQGRRFARQQKQQRAT